MDADLTDWCVGAFSNTAPGGGRIEDSSVILTCGQCSFTTDHACAVNTDCPFGETCLALTSKTEIAWWDNRTDGAVNDLGTVVTTYDNTNLYFAAELWVDPDPVSLPFAEIALDVKPGGKNTWHDPNSKIVTPGHCSTFTDRGCTSNADCHFCQLSKESPPSTRVRTCGSGCDPNIGDVCEVDQTCIDLGAGGLANSVGPFSDPSSEPDYLLVFDFAVWLTGANGGRATRLMNIVNDTWTRVDDFIPRVNPGASGGSGGPPGSVEVAIPWSAFGCTGCPNACSCPDFGPGDDMRFTIVVVRGTAAPTDYAPDGAIEDVMSETVAGVTTTSTNSCPGFGIVTTNCEIADGSTDAFVPPLAPVAVAGGRIDGLTASSNGGASLTLSWNPSCSSADTDYEVYEGSLGTWTDHVPVPGLCTTAGATTATFDSGVGSKYYLIVPTDGAVEGSYGEDSDGFERQASTAECVTQRLGLCN